MIPSRHRSGTPSNYIAIQQELFVQPFLRAVEASGANPRILLQVILNDDMLRDAEFRSDLLNWVTGLPNVAGVYLILAVPGRSKQIVEQDLLYSLLDFVWVFRSVNELDVVLGYLNTEAILMMIADPTIVTMGSYENTRAFDLRAFRIEEGANMRGPRPRVFVSKLLQWISHTYLDALQREVPYGSPWVDENPHRVEMFAPEFRWHFQNPVLYKHYFLSMAAQVEELRTARGAARYEKVVEKIEEAMEWFAALENAGVVLNRDEGDEHLRPWLTAANRFARDRGWRG